MLAPMAYAPMAMPSNTACGSPSRAEQSMKAPGSPSSPLQMKYLTPSGDLVPGGELPLLPGGEAGAATPAQPRALDLVDHLEPGVMLDSTLYRA